MIKYYFITKMAAKNAQSSQKHVDSAPSAVHVPDMACLNYTSDSSATTPDDLTIIVMNDDIFNLSGVDVMLHVLPDTLNVNEKSFTTALFLAAGEEMKKDVIPLLKSQKMGQVTRTAGFKLKCTSVVHGTCRAWKFGENDPAEQSLRTVYRNALLKADELKAASIACPPVGTGSLGFAYDMAAKILFEETIKFSAAHKQTTLKTVLFVIYGSNQEKHRRIYEAFIDVMSSHVKKRSSTTVQL